MIEPLRNPDPGDAPANKQAEIKTYVDAMTAAGAKDKIVGYGEFGFAEWVDLAKIMSNVKACDSTLGF